MSHRYVTQMTSVSADLIFSESQTDLFDNKPRREDGNTPQAKVDVCISQKSHAGHTAQTIL